MIRMTGQQTRSRIEEIIWCEGQADQEAGEAEAYEAAARVNLAEAQAKRSTEDDLRWTAARLIFEELATEKTQRQLASEIGKSQQHVSWMNRVWRDYGDTDDHGSERRTFDSIYQEVKETPDPHQRERQDRQNERRIEVRELAEKGESTTDIAEKLNVTRRTIQRDLEEGPLPPKWREANDGGCDLYDGTRDSVARFKEEVGLLLNDHKLAENPAYAKAIRKIVNRLINKLDKIEKESND